MASTATTKPEGSYVPYHQIKPSFFETGAGGKGIPCWNHEFRRMVDREGFDRSGYEHYPQWKKGYVSRVNYVHVPGEYSEWGMTIEDWPQGNKHLAENLEFWMTVDEQARYT